jgi:hypothetical protein
MGIGGSETSLKAQRFFSEDERNFDSAKLFRVLSILNVQRERVQMAKPLTDAEKKTALLVQLVKSGVVDLSSIADAGVKALPADFDLNNPDLGGTSFGFVDLPCFLGPRLA